MLAGSALCYLLGAGFSDSLRSSVQFAFVPMGDLGMGTVVAINADPTYEIDDIEKMSKAQIANLIKQNRLLRTQVSAISQRYVDTLAQAQLIDQLYDRYSGFECRLIPARVVGMDALGYSQSRLINAGSSSGAASGSAVTTRQLLTDRAKALPQELAAITSTALIGRLAGGGAFSSRLVLVSDSGYSIRAQLKRVINPDDPRKILVSNDGGASFEPLSRSNNGLLDVHAGGDGSGGLVIRHVSSQHNVRVGDLLWTRPGDPYLPARIMIGRVDSVVEASDKPHFVTVHIKPEADLDALREVFVVVPLGRLGQARG